MVNENSEIRRRAIQAAMISLGEGVLVDATSKQISEPLGNGGGDDADFETFFNRDEKLKPSDYALLCAAYYYSIYGAIAFSGEELRAIASDAGVVLPDRLDMTLKQAVKKGKKLFQAAGKGAFKPTAGAGIYFKEKWDVRPGKRAKNPAKASE